MRYLSRELSGLRVGLTNRNMFIITHRRIFTAISLVLVALSLVSVFMYGLNYSIDFTGGSVLEVSYPDGRPNISEIEEVTQAVVESDDILVRPVGDVGYSIRVPFFSGDGERVALIETLSENHPDLVEEKVSSIGPVIGQELKGKALSAIVIVVIVIVLFVAFSFRKVSKPVSAWWYGFIAIVALIHDIIIPLGVFSFFQFDVDVLFVTALLAILGYSVNDTIVVFDRIRENLRHNRDLHIKESFDKTVGQSITQTIGRSVNTSLTTLITLCTLLILTGSSIHHFIIALLVGVVAGTYSSIFLASPFLVFVYSWKTKK